MKIEDVIAAACEELQISYAENAMWFKVLINQAVKTMKNADALKLYDEKLEMEDNRIKLPANFVKFHEIHECSTGSQYCERYDFDIQNECLIFHTYFNFANGTQFVLRYSGVAMTDDGELILKDKWERMLVAYIGWKYCRRHFEKYGSILPNYQREFQVQKAANF